MTSDGERLAILETKVESLQEMKKQVKEMHDLLLKAKGARWALFIIPAIMGLLGSKAAAVLAAVGIDIRPVP